MRDSFDLGAIGDGKPVADSQFIETLSRYLFQGDMPRFLFDDPYHFIAAFYKQHPYADVMLPRAKYMFSVLAERIWEQDIKDMFLPESISGGRDSYWLGSKHEKRIRDFNKDYQPSAQLRIKDDRGVLSTYRLSEKLDANEIKYRVIEPNRNRATARWQAFQTAYPDRMIFSPSGAEAALQNIIKDPGVSNLQGFRDEDFEAFWIAVCYMLHTAGLEGDVAFSRNGNFETFAFFQMRYGMIPFRPKADADLVFANGDQVTPHDFLRMIFAHMLEVVPQGFVTDMSSNIAMRMIMLEEMRTKGWKHPEWGGLDLKKVNPGLMDLPGHHDKAFAELASQVIAFMDAHNCMRELWKADGLRDYGVKRARNLKRSRFVPKSVAELQNEILPPAAEQLDVTKSLQGKRAPLITMQTPYQTDGHFFKPENEAGLFAQDLFRRSDARVKTVLQLNKGVEGIPKMPIVGGQFGEVIVLGDRRANRHAQAWAQAHGIKVIQDGRGLRSSFEGANFEQKVVEDAIIDVTEAANFCRKAFPGRVVTHTENAERVYKAFTKDPKVIAAPGNNKIETPHKIADWQENIRRQGFAALSLEAWETSPFLVPLRVYSRLLQFDIVPKAHAFPLQVGDLIKTDDGFTIETRSLVDDIRIMAAYAKDIDAAQEEIPSFLMKGLLHSLALADMYYDAELNRAAGSGEPLIDMQTIPLDVKTGLEKDRVEFRALLNEMRAILLGPQIQTLDLEDVSRDMAKIDPTFWRRWLEVDGLRRTKPAQGPRQGRLTGTKGPDTGMPAP